jgi:shikimate kinase
VKELRDGLEIIGNSEKLHPAKIKTYHDHRMAMCFGVAQFFIPEIKIENPSCVKKTYPNFWKDIAALKKKFLEKNIILTGMRGSGKSRLGALLGRSLGRRFYDIDELIEQKAKKSIPKIVAKHGWRYFRSLESRIVKGLRNVRSAVIATGGGTLMHPFNVKILKSNGKIIFLESAVASLKKRLAKHYDRPPLTRGEDFLSELEMIYQRREKKYREKADAIIDVSRQTGNKKRDLDQKLKRILAVISRFGLL